MIKKLLVLIGVLVALFLIVAVFLPSSYTVERSVEIDRAPEEVFPQVVDLNQWTKWNAWTAMDPDAKNTVTGEPGAIGSQWAWDGETVGVGSMTVTNVVPNQSIDFKLTFVSPMEAEANDTWKFEPTASGTKITWTDGGELAYPIGRYFGLQMDSMLGSQFETGLSNLKKICEEMPPAAPMMHDMPLMDEGDKKEGTGSGPTN